VCQFTQSIANINNVCSMSGNMHALFTLTWVLRYSMRRIIFTVINDSLYIGAGKRWGCMHLAAPVDLKL